MTWRDKDRGTYATYNLDYRRKRTACLKHANWKCEIRIPGICIGAASQADHTYGTANDPHHEHLRAACEPCHRKVTAQQGAGWRRSRKTQTDPEPKPATQW